MRDEAEMRVKRAYWEGVYYALDPDRRARSPRSRRQWLTAETWLKALDWALGQAMDTGTTLEPMTDKTIGWDEQPDAASPTSGV